MKKKGLIVFIAVGVLVLLGLTFYPTIKEFLEENGDHYKNLENALEESAKEFVKESPNFLPENGQIKKVSGAQLERYRGAESPTDTKGNACEESYVVLSTNENGETEYTTCLKCGKYATKDRACEQQESSYETNYVLRYETVDGEAYQAASWGKADVYQELSVNYDHSSSVKTYQKKIDNGEWENIEGNSFISSKDEEVCVRSIDENNEVSEESCYSIKLDKDPITVTAAFKPLGYILGTDQLNEKIQSLFEFGSFGRSGGEIVCKEGDTLVYKNENGNVTVDEWISKYQEEGNYLVSCTSTSGSGLTQEASSYIEIVSPEEKTFTEDTKYTIPADGFYQITGSGAQGSRLGDTISGKMFLERGMVLEIKVGKTSAETSTIVTLGEDVLLTASGGEGSTSLNYALTEMFRQDANTTGNGSAKIKFVNF